MSKQRRSRPVSNDRRFRVSDTRFYYEGVNLPSADAVQLACLKPCAHHNNGGGHRVFNPCITFYRNTHAIFGPACRDELGLDKGFWLRFGMDPSGHFLRIQAIFGRFVTENASNKNGAYASYLGGLADLDRLVEHYTGTQPVRVRLDTDRSRAKKCHVHSPGTVCWRLKVNIPVVVSDTRRGLTLTQEFPFLQNMTFPLMRNPACPDREVIALLEHGTRLDTRRAHTREDLTGLQKFVVPIQGDRLVDRPEDWAL